MAVGEGLACGPCSGVPPGWEGGVRLACVRGLLFNALGAATVIKFKISGMIFNFSMFNYFNVRLFWVANSIVCRLYCSLPLPTNNMPYNHTK